MIRKKNFAAQKVHFFQELQVKPVISGKFSNYTTLGKAELLRERRRQNPNQLKSNSPVLRKKED